MTNKSVVLIHVGRLLSACDLICHVERYGSYTEETIRELKKIEDSLIAIASTLEQSAKGVK